MLRAGTQVGDFVIESSVGEGGMAQVYLARHPLLDTRHAIKLLDPQLRANADARQRFLDEARIQAKHLDHPGIVKVTYVIATEEHAALVMEFVDGPSLESEAATLAQRPDEVRRIMLSVLDAVGYAHDAGIIHRDLKPANILLAGPGRRPKVTDFGIAKVSDDLKRPGKKSTRAEARMGTLNYSSPEQVLSAKDVTPRSDIWSLGVILYELATGAMPFDAETDYALMDQIVKGRYVAPDTVNPGIDPSLAAVIRRAMDPDPVRRFATCAEMAEALRPPSRPVSVVPTKAPLVDLSDEHPAPTSEPKSWRAFAIAVSLGGVVLVVGLAAYFIGGRAEPPKASGPPPRRGTEESLSPTRVTASSTMKTFGGYYFDPLNLIDGDISTSWQPSTRELRNGATWVQLEFPNDVSLSAIRIANGFQTIDKNGDEFVLNSRIALARALLSDGTTIVLKFSGSERGFVRFDIPPAKPTRTVRLIVDTIHRGAPRPAGSRLSDDLAISEIELLGSSTLAGCQLAALECHTYQGVTQTGTALHKLVYDARVAHRYAEAICLAQGNLGSSDAWLRGATHFEISNAWQGLGCKANAIDEVTASLAVRPREKGGWKETCDWCKDLGASCEVCAIGGPALRSVNWDAKLAAENKGPFEMGPPSVSEVIYGDLDGDGSEEAVVRSMIPDFKSQALDVYALRGGAVVKIGTIDGGWRTDGGVDTIHIRDGFLFIDRTQLGPDDPMGAPSLVSSERWFVSGDLLKEDSAFRKTRKR